MPTTQQRRDKNDFDYILCVYSRNTVENLFARQMRTNASQVVQEATSKAQPIFARQLDALHGRAPRDPMPMPTDEAEMLAGGDAARAQHAVPVAEAGPGTVDEDDEAAELQRMREQYLGAARWVLCTVQHATLWMPYCVSPWGCLLACIDAH